MHVAGGSCTCPDGKVYQVGDEGNMCWSVACEGGVQGTCNEEEGGWSFRKVVCAPAVAHKKQSQNVVIEGDETAGVWGGTCTCPDGQVRRVALRSFPDRVSVACMPLSDACSSSVTRQSHASPWGLQL